MRKQRLIPPILVPILKVRSPAHDGGRLRMKTPPRARTGPRWVSSASARATLLAPDLFRQRVVPLGRERASKSGTKRLASWQFCFEAFQPAGDPDGAEVARTTIPEHGHTGIRARLAQVGLVQKDRIEGLPQSHRRSRFSCFRGALVKKTCRTDIPRREQPIAACQKRSDLCARKSRLSRRLPRSKRRDSRSRF